MWSHKLWLLLALTLIDKNILLVASSCKCGQVFDDENFGARVVGGGLMSPESHPFLVLLLANNLFTCGATLISPTYVLTAGHCINPHCKSKNYKVAVGVHNRVRWREMRNNIHDVKKVIRHKGYEKSHTEIILNDIALLEIEHIKFNNFIQPICLPIGLNLGKYKSAKLIGWGTFDVRFHYPSSTPRQAVLELLTSELCKRSPLYPVLQATRVPNIMQQMVYGYRREVDACMQCYQGDSGGPFYIKDKRSTHYQIGVVSTGRGCSNSEGWPGVYTSVQYHLNWIKDHVKDLCSPPS